MSTPKRDDRGRKAAQANPVTTPIPPELFPKGFFVKGVVGKLLSFLHKSWTAGTKK